MAATGSLGFHNPVYACAWWIHYRKTDGVLVDCGSFGSSFLVAGPSDTLLSLEFYGFYMKYNVFNQNQLNVGVSAWEPCVTLAAKSNDSALPRLGATLRTLWILPPFHCLSSIPTCPYSTSAMGALSCTGNVFLPVYASYLACLSSQDCLTSSSLSLTPPWRTP